MSNSKSKSNQLNYTLRDCAEQNRLYPELFFIPKPSDINSLQVGSIVKLIFINLHTSESERMWVTITEINQDEYVGLLSNNPELITGLKFKDKVIFHKSNIANIYQNSAS